MMRMLNFGSADPTTSSIPYQRTRKASQNSMENKIGPRPGSQKTTSSMNRCSTCALLDILIECDRRDSGHPSLEGMTIKINGIKNENRETLQLERVDSNIWRHNNVVELPKIGDELLLAVQSEYGDLCHLFLQRVDLGDFTISGGESSGPRSELVTREDIPTLLLSFIKLNVPRDENGTGTAQLPVPNLERFVFVRPIGPRDTPSHWQWDSDIMMAAKLCAYARLFLQKFEYTKDLRALSTAIVLVQRAVEVAPQRDPNMPGFQSYLEELLSLRSQRMENSRESASTLLNIVIECDHRDSDHPCLENMAIGINGIWNENLKTLQLERVSANIWRHNDPVELSWIDDQFKLVVQSEYGDLCHLYFQRVDLRNFRINSPELFARPRCESVTRADVPTLLLAFIKINVLTDENATGTALLPPASLERFIFESPTSPSDVSRHWQADIMMAKKLEQFGAFYLHKFEETGHPPALAGAIQLFRGAVDLTPPGDPNMPGRQSYLGKLLSLRFRYMGDPCDISEAILFQQKAVNLTQDDAEMHSRLNNLGVSFRYRYVYTGDPRDVFEAISLQQKAVDHTPEGHVDFPGLLHNLGILLMARFEITEDLHDVSETISIQKKAIELSSQGHPNRRKMLSNISNSFRNRFLRTKELADINEAISLQRESLDFSPKVHAEFIEMSSGLHNLGILLRGRFEITEALSDISEAISVENKAVTLTPLGYRDTPSFLNSLGLSLERLFDHTKDLKDIRQSISRYKQAATWSTGIPIFRFSAAEKWAQLSAKFDRSESTLFDAYNTTIQLLSRVVGLEQTVERRYIGLATISKISVEAVAAAFSLGRHETALEWLEHGRCLVWNRLNDLRTPLDALRKHNSALADHFYDISRRLEHSGHRSEFLSIGNDASMAQKMSIQEDVNTHVKLAQEWERTLEKIRNIPEFEDFLRPPRAFGLLKKLPTDGDVIVINVHETRCDALALISGAEAPLHVPLHNFSHEQADNLRSLLHGYLLSWGLRSRGSESEPDEIRGAHQRSSIRKNDNDIRSILGQLWLNVVKPILDKLAISRHPSDLRRIWWCATGPLAFLPIHAAGLYGQDHTAEDCLSNYAISSYTPTITTLIGRTKEVKLDQRGPKKLLLISQPNTRCQTPIPGAKTEVDDIFGNLTGRGFEAKCLEDGAATVDEVMKMMESHSWIHFACHGSQNTKSALQSAFYLHDGELILTEIIKKQLDNADLAFLSACQTSTGEEKLSEEAVHLAGGMLAAGYRGVVATMWSIMDQYGPEIAVDFYKYILNSAKTGEGGKEVNSDMAAYALHYATGCIRKKLGDSESGLLAWVPYVHFGY